MYVIIDWGLAQNNLGAGLSQTLQNPDAPLLSPSGTSRHQPTVTATTVITKNNRQIPQRLADFASRFTHGFTMLLQLRLQRLQSAGCMSPTGVCAKKESSREEGAWKYRMEHVQIRVWRGVPAAVLQGQGSRKRTIVVCSQTTVGTRPPPFLIYNTIDGLIWGKIFVTPV